MRAALQLFLTNGYAGTSIKAVADELEVSPPALYWYFPSKEDLYVSVIEKSMEDFLHFVRQSVTDDDPVFKLSQLVRAHVTWQLDQSEVAQVFDRTVMLRGRIADIPDSKLTAVTTMQRDYIDMVRVILREGVSDGVFVVEDVKTTAFAIVTLCEYVTAWYKPDGDLGIPAVANRYETLVRRMVGAGSRRTSADVAGNGTI